MQFSVIVLTYNSALNEVIQSINSILKQRNVEYEIIISDDGSKINNESQIREFFIRKDFLKFKFLSTGENVGTVRNALNGLAAASGKIVKLLGAGDFLFSNTTLKEIAEFMAEDSCLCCFGGMTAYSYNKNGEIEISDFNHPRDLSVYENNKNDVLKFRNIIGFEDWISGASMFFKKECLCAYLKNMVGTVKYCEDLIAAELALNGIYFSYIGKPVVWYKIGEGISTAENDTFKEKLREDHKKYWRYLEKEYSNKYLNKSNEKRIIRATKSRLHYYLFNPKRLIFEIKLIIQGNKKNDNCMEAGFLDELLSEEY